MEAPQSEEQESETPLPETAPAVSIGTTLRNARLERGEDPSTIASALKMRPDQLEAIENNDFSRLPGRTYAIGFVRAYARHLGLDAETLIQKFKDGGADQDLGKPVQLVFPEAIEEQRLPNGSILIVALVIAMVIYGVSYLTMPNRKTPAATAKADEPAVVIVQPGSTKSESTPSESTPPDSMTSVVSAPASQAAESNTPAGSTADASSTSNVTVAPPATFIAGSATLPTPSLPAAMAPVETPRDGLDGASLLPSATLIVAQTTTSEAAGAQAAAANGTAATASRVTLKALQPTYVKIKDPRQPGAAGVLIDRVLNPGESYQAPDRAGLVMQTGNAGGLQVEVDGRNVGVLGKSGEVITRIPVDPSYFLERMAASQ